MQKKCFEKVRSSQDEIESALENEADDTFSSIPRTGYNFPEEFSNVSNILESIIYPNFCHLRFLRFLVVRSTI